VDLACLGHADSDVEKAVLKPHTVAPSRRFSDELENNAQIVPLPLNDTALLEAEDG